MGSFERICTGFLTRCDITRSEHELSKCLQPANSHLVLIPAYILLAKTSTLGETAYEEQDHC